jgi:hypothetical protein
LGDEVNFRLTYDGPLKAASQSDTRRVEKHAIRRVFARQLNELYKTRDAEFLAAEWDAEPPLPVKRGPFLCVALVREKLNLVCDLDILFLRRENPGQLISSGGDLDNRVKVLFDAFRIPQDDNEVRGLEPTEEGRVLLCLVEDDKLITGFRVTTDRLLESASSEVERNNVRLIINVEVKATKLTTENMAYFSHF